MRLRFFPVAVCVIFLFAGVLYAADKKDAISDEMAYTVRVKKKFDTVLSDLNDAIIDNNFKVINVSNIKKGLGSRDVQFGEYTVVEFCNLTLAEKVLKRDLRLGLLMPCRIAVYEDRDEVVVTTIRPTFVTKQLGDRSLMDIAADIEKHMKDIIDSIK